MSEEGEGNQAPWFGELGEETPQELKDWIGNKNFADPVTALQSHFNTEKLLGHEKAGRTVVLPKDENDAEGLAAFRAKMGVPESAEGYELPVPEGESEEFSKMAATWFHEAGVPKPAAVAFAEKWNTFVAEMEEKERAMDEKERSEAQAKSELELNALKQEWGDAYDQKAEFAKRGQRAYGSKAGLDTNDLEALESAIGTTKMLKLFHALGESTAESDFVAGEHKNFSMTPSEAQAKLDEARKQRMAGDITEQQFMAVQDKYGPIVNKVA